MDDVGASDAFGRGFVVGTRREAAADGGGRTKPLPGRGGADALLNVGGLRRGGLDGLLNLGGGGGGGCIDICGVSLFCATCSPPVGKMSTSERGEVDIVAVPLEVSSRVSFSESGAFSSTKTGGSLSCPSCDFTSSADLSSA
jgi:hypothetical protein